MCIIFYFYCAGLVFGCLSIDYPLPLAGRRPQRMGAATFMTTIRSSSVWSMPQIEQFLQDTRIPARLAFLSADGAPQLCSLWYLYDSGLIWCATQQNARLSALLARDGRCAFEVAGDNPPYRGVRGQGQAAVCAAEGRDVLLRLIDRYLQQRDSGFARWLIARSETEVAIRISPRWLTSWDFGARMSS